MSNYEEVKYKLRDFIIENTSIEKEKIFFATERFSMPEKPYIMIMELSSLEDLESGYENKGLVKEITNYKNSIFTVAIYNLSENDLSEENNLTRNILEDIRNAFKIAQFNHSLKNYFTIQSITDLRPLNEITETGFLFRYEFDITCGYNEIISTELKQSQGVIIDLDTNNIHIEVNKENMHV